MTITDYKFQIASGDSVMDVPWDRFPLDLPLESAEMFEDTTSGDPSKEMALLLTAVAPAVAIAITFSDHMTDLFPIGELGNNDKHTLTCRLVGPDGTVWHQYVTDVTLMMVGDAQAVGLNTVDLIDELAPDSAIAAASEGFDALPFKASPKYPMLDEMNAIWSEMAKRDRLLLIRHASAVSIEVMLNLMSDPAGLPNLDGFFGDGGV